MSAITGIFYRDGRNVDEEQIKKMNDRLSHRDLMDLQYGVKDQ